MLRKFFHRLLYPKSLRWQFSLALWVQVVLISVGGFTAVRGLQISSDTAGQLTETRLVRMQEAQDLVRLSLLIDLASRRLLATDSSDTLQAAYLDILQLLDQLDATVLRLGRASNSLFVLALYKSDQLFRNTIHIITELHRSMLDNNDITPGRKEALDRFHGELENQALSLVDSARDVSTRFTLDSQENLRQLRAASKKEGRWALALLAGSVLMAWLISRFFIGKFVVGRLEQISACLRFEKTDTGSGQVPVKGDDEIGRMARAVEQFLEAYRLLLETQQRLRQSENMLQTIVNAAPIAIFGLDPDGNVHSVWNREAERMLGWSAAEVMGRPLPSVPGSSQGEFRGFLEQIRQGQSLNGVEVLRQRRDGTPIHYSIYTSPLRDSGGSIIGNIAALVDIEERRQMEHALKLTRFSIDHALQAIYWIAPDGRFIDVNETASGMLGYSKSELLAMGIPDIDPKFPMDIWPAFWEKIRKNQTAAFETTCRRKDGTVFPVEVAANYIEFEGREYNCAFVRNITDRKFLDDQLKKRQLEQKQYYAFLKVLIDTVPNPLFFKDHADRFNGCNPAFENLVGKSGTEIIGSTGYDLFGQELADRFRRMEETLLRGDSAQAHEFIFPNAEGGFLDMICYLAGFCEIDSGREGFVGILLDITPQKQVEAELRQIRKKLETTVGQLQQANRKIIAQQKSIIEEERLKVLLQMAGATAQELSQPLMVLLGSIELIQNQPLPDTRYLERIKTAGYKVSEFVHKILKNPVGGMDSCTRQALPPETGRQITVLSVEDDESDFELLTSYIFDTGLDIHLIHAGGLKQAFEILEVSPVDLILMDYMLSDGTGLEFLESIRQREIEIPVVMLTGYGDEVIASQSIQAGAYDYLPKTKLTSAALGRVIGNALEKHCHKHEMKRMMAKMASMATRDELTGLYNRRYFNESLSTEIEKAGRYGRDLSLAIFDLDHFKEINDLYGHQAGDHVLREAGRIIQKMIRRHDIACRYGGEEIAVIMPDTACKNGSMTCNRVLDGFRGNLMEFDEKRFVVTASAGIASYDPATGMTEGRFVQTVDDLLYQAKTLGRDRVLAEKFLNNHPV